MKRNIIILQIHVHVPMHSDLLLALTFEAALKETKGGGAKPPKNFCCHLNDYHVCHSLGKKLRKLGYPPPAPVSTFMTSTYDEIHCIFVSLK